MTSEGDWDAVLSDWCARAAQVVYGRTFHHFRDPDLAAVATQDALLKALETGKARPKYCDDYAHLVNWLTKTARWRGLDLLRRQKLQRPLPEGWDGSEPDAAPQADRDRVRQQVWDLLQRLPAEERDLLDMSYFQKLTDREIYERLHGPEEFTPACGLRVWRQRQKAQAHLRQLLLQEGVDPSEWGLA
jgi:RNA polymerase sigma factor (sigma-70 family)